MSSRLRLWPTNTTGLGYCIVFFKSSSTRNDEEPQWPFAIVCGELFRPSLNFQTFSIDSVNRRVIIQGQETLIGARAFDVLFALAERYRQVVSKHVLLSTAWPGLVVEENNLQVQIASLRKVLGKEAITTVSGRGYCMMQFLVDLPRPPSPA